MAPPVLGGEKRGGGEKREKKNAQYDNPAKEQFGCDRIIKGKVPKGAFYKVKQLKLHLKLIYLFRWSIIKYY